jgi:hypothetical protein
MTFQTETVLSGSVPPSSRGFERLRKPGVSSDRAQCRSGRISLGQHHVGLFSSDGVVDGQHESAGQLDRSVARLEPMRFDGARAKPTTVWTGLWLLGRRGPAESALTELGAEAMLPPA